MERARKKVFVVSAKRRNKEAGQFHLNGRGISIFYPNLFSLSRPFLADTPVWFLRRSYKLDQDCGPGTE
jgi:hypothetical protein